MLEDLGSLSPSSSFMIPLMCYLHCTGPCGLACGESRVPYSIGYRLTYGMIAPTLELTWHEYRGFKDSLVVLCTHVRCAGLVVGSRNPMILLAASLHPRARLRRLRSG